jgi:hypothetical protein
MAAASPMPQVTIGDGFARWQRLWASMSELAATGARASAEDKRVGIFGAGMTAATWLVHTALHSSSLVGLFDESPWKIGRTLFGQSIHAMSSIRSHELDLVLIATMPNSQALVRSKLVAACGPSTVVRGFEAVA